MTVALSVILPCFNEGPTLPASLGRIVLTLDRLGRSYELILIDDASRDRTPDRIQAFAETASAPVQVVRHRENRGRGATVREGMTLAEGSVVGFLDVDLEVGPHYIPLFYDAIVAGADVATGRRIYPVSAGGLVRFGLSRGYNRLIRSRLGLPFSDTEAGFKFFAADAAQALVAETSDPGWFWDTEVLAVAWRKGLEVVEIPCLFLRREDKRSTVRVIPDTLGYLRSLRRFRER
jgi:glycosyltransferase involved in cell wall biosynthesis